MEENAFDPNRRLCPDGSCVGVIGPDGRCSVCARTAEAAAAGEPAMEAEPHEAAPALSDGSAGFDPGRRLCDDGSCVGVVGADGRCNVCGQQAGG
jgi:hypothetical protein